MCYNKGLRPPPCGPAQKRGPYGTATHCILRVQLRRVPVFHAAARGSSSQRQLALRYSASERRLLPGQMDCADCRSSTPAVFCAGCAMRACAGARGFAHCAACGEYPCAIMKKKPALRQRRPRGAGRPALKWAACPAAFSAQKNAPCTGRARTEKHAFFAGAIGSRPQAMPAACAVPAGACFPYASQNKSFLHGPGTPAPPAFFYNQGPALSAWRTQGLRVCITGKPLNRRQN